MHIKITVIITNNIRVRLGNRSESTVFTVNTKRMSKPILKSHRKLKTLFTRYLLASQRHIVTLYCSGLKTLNGNH